MRYLQKHLTWAGVLIALVGCNTPGYVYYYANVPPQVSFQKKVKDIAGNPHLDMIWQIGGMTELTATLLRGVDSFMNTFTQVGGIDWRMGVLANDVSAPPMLGFAPGSTFDVHTPNPQSLFHAAVADSVGNYDAEMEMDPIVSNLTADPGFIRSGAILVLILSNDNHDESATSVQDFLNYLVKLKGDLSQVIVYGVLGTTDLGCADGTIDEDWNYSGSSFETLIQATHGKVYSLCTADFGTSLGNIGNDLISRLTYPRIFLASRPIPSSIVVTYHGVPLKAGTQESGAAWYYDYDLNAIVFYSLAFASGDTESVQVTYSEDQGNT